MIPELGNWQYHRDDRLGGGGYAQAYRCHGHGHSAKDYAIKVFDNPHYANTFEKEVLALQTMAGCPATPALIDYGRNAEGQLAIVTSFAPGVRLDQHLRTNGPLTAEKTENLLEQMLGVLAFAHSRNFLHKDVSSFNILMHDNGFVLLDWGVSERIGNGRSEAIRAKQEFVAPECYFGNHSATTDFYALGWLAVQALTGALPYHFEVVREADYRVAAHCLERPELSPSLPGHLFQLIANWLGKNPANRLAGDNLAELCRQVQNYQIDFSYALDFRQLKRDCGYLHQAARHGIPFAQYQLALRLLKEKRRHAACYWLEKAWHQGYSQAGYRLARLLARGREEEEKIRAQELLKEAASAGHIGAQYELALSLLQDKTVAPDIDQAISLLRQAAVGGHGQSQYTLAKLLLNELGRPEEAKIYFALAADRGL